MRTIPTKIIFNKKDQEILYEEVKEMEDIIATYKKENKRIHDIIELISQHHFINLDIRKSNPTIVSINQTADSFNITLL